MQIHLQADDGVPMYKQIIAQVKSMIATQRLSPGDDLPSVRALAQQLLVNPNTVARAYRDLETMGLVISQRGRGTTVSHSGSPLARDEQRQIINNRIDALLAEAALLGFTLREIKQMLDDAANNADSETQESV